MSIYDSRPSTASIYMTRYWIMGVLNNEDVHMKISSG
jgi:hypothetical protein